VKSGGTYYATISVYASGSTQDITIAGGIEIVSDGGISDSTYLKQGTSETVLHKGVANDTRIDGNAKLIVSSAGMASSSRIYNGGELLVESGGTSKKTIDVSAVDFVFSGGRAIDANIKNGLQIVSGGKSFGTNLASSGDQILNAGAISIATHIDYRCTQYLGGIDETALTGYDIAYNTMDSGTENVYSAGKTSGTVILYGGSEYVDAEGASYGTKVSKGTEYVSSGGVAIGTTVYNGGTETKKYYGGTEIVASGGITSRTTIEGGRLEIEKGGKAAGLVTFSGTDGKLIIDAIAMPTATISGFAATDSIILSAIPYATSDSVTVNAENIVTISAGGKTYTLHIAGATIGETDFSFGPGSILTRAAPTQPSFLRPQASAAPAENILAQTPVLTSASPIQAPTAAAAASSATHPPAWQPVNALTLHQETIAQLVSSHTT